MLILRDGVEIKVTAETSQGMFLNEEVCGGGDCMMGQNCRITQGGRGHWAVHYTSPQSL